MPQETSRLYGACACERNQYLIELPVASVSSATIFFDNSARSSMSIHHILPPSSYSSHSTPFILFDPVHTVPFILRPSIHSTPFILHCPLFPPSVSCHPDKHPKQDDHKPLQSRPGSASRSTATTAPPSLASPTSRTPPSAAPSSSHPPGHPLRPSVASSAVTAAPI